jgi:hypothetical protein
MTYLRDTALVVAPRVLTFTQMVESMKVYN